MMVTLHVFRLLMPSFIYRLPQEIDATKIASSLSADGIMTVEAPVPEPSIPDTIIIPIKVIALSTRFYS